MPTVHPGLERLEERVLLTLGDSIATAIPLAFSSAAQIAHATGDLSNPDDARIYQINLNAGDVVTASVNTAPYGGGLDSYLRILEDLGPNDTPEIAANDNYEGRDPALSFQAPVSGIYLVAVSSFDNRTYDPRVPDSGVGSSRGLFDLNCFKTAAAPAPALTASSFQISQTAAEWGDTVTVQYTIENRGAAAAPAISASLLLSGDDLFDDGIPALQVAPVGPLAAGGSVQGSFTVLLNDAGTPLSSYSEIFLGLGLGGAVPSSPEQGNDWAPLQILTPATSDGSNRTRATAQPIALNSRTDGIALGPLAEAFFQVVVIQPGNLSAQVDAGGLPVALTLYDPTGIPIVQSDGTTPANLGPSITQGLSGSVAGTDYYLKVANLRDATGSFQLTTQFTLSDSVLQAVPLASKPGLLATGDFNGDGQLDLAVSQTDAVAILLGNGDGTFQKGATLPVRFTPQALVTGDFNGDGRLDLAMTSNYAPGVTVLLGNGDGTFSVDTVTGANGDSLAVGDFEGNGQVDLAVANSATNQVVILQNAGAGAFSVLSAYTVPSGPTGLLAADFNGDGLPDLAVADRVSDQVSVLINQGGGAFNVEAPISVGVEPVALAAGDFDLSSGHIDLAVADLVSQDVRILLGDGAGGFTLAQTLAVGGNPGSLVTADFNSDGQVDLATANPFADTMTVLLGNGDGMFQKSASAPTGADPLGLVAGDFNGDGNVDLASANYYAQNVTVLLGHGDGTFPQIGSPNATGQNPDAMVTGDFNGDGRLDLAVANYRFGTVTVLLGQGDGTFESAGTFPVDPGPVAIADGDFNGDGRLDLATANYSSESITVLMGNGDGTFQPGRSISLAGKPSALVAADLDGTGNLDLAVTLKFDSLGNGGNQVVVLPGDGRGDFGSPRSFTLTPLAPGGTQPNALVAGDFNGDGVLDLAVSDSYTGDVAVLLGAGGTFAAGTFAFAPSVFYPVPGTPVALVAGAFNGDQALDLAVATNYPGADLTVLRNTGQGQFASGPGDFYALPDTIKSLVAGDFTGDGLLDLAAANAASTTYPYPLSTTVTLLLGTSRGQFNVQPDAIAVGDEPDSIVAGDFNGDGKLDLAIAGLQTAQVSVFLGTGPGAFVSDLLAPSPVESTPLVAPLTGPTDDAVVLTQSGQILFRRGLADQPGAFAPPVVLNPGPAHAARALALVEGSGGTLLAALDADDFAVTLYQPHADGTFTIASRIDLPAGFSPATLAAADLTGRNLGDLVIGAAASNQIFVVLQTAPGVFAPAQSYSVGLNPSAIDLADVNGDGRPDIVVTDRFSGQVSVLLNDGNGQFESEDNRFRAGAGPYSLSTVNGIATAQSPAGSNGLVAGFFDNRAGTDLVVINSGDQSFTLLSSDDSGGFLNPQPEQTIFTPGTPTAIVAGDFNNDGNLDLAVLCADTDTLSIYSGDGAGHFALAFTADAGNQPTGLSVADVTRPGGGGSDGIDDLLIGNVFGDLLILTGNGDGTFSQYRRADQQVSLAVASSGGANTFFFSDQANDQLAYKTAAASALRVEEPTVFQNRSAGIQAPGAQAVVNVVGIQYLIVLNSGGNDLFIYTLDSAGMPVPGSKQTYDTGTAPVGLTVTGPADDLNGDAIPDVVVANQGSNDVSIFLGQMNQDGWSLAYRPRESSGGLGPTSVAIADVSGPDRLPELLVSNSESNRVNVLVNRGDGFFVNPGGSVVPAFLTGAQPQQVLVGNFDSAPGLDLVTINAGSNDVTLISNFLGAAPVLSTFSSGGLSPQSALVADVRGVNVLLVANSGNGVVELLADVGSGFQVLGDLGQATPHLSDLVLVSTRNGQEVYASVAGREVAVLLGTFGADLIAPAPLPASPGFPGGLIVPPGGPDLISAATDASIYFVLSVGLYAAGPIVANDGVALSPLGPAFNGVLADASESAPGLTGPGQLANPSRILLRNVADPPPTVPVDPLDPNDDEETNDFLCAPFLQAQEGPIAEGGLPMGPIVPAAAALADDSNQPPIPLQRPAPRAECAACQMEIELHPAARREIRDAAARASVAAMARGANLLACTGFLAGLAGFLPLIFRPWLPFRRLVFSELSKRLKKLAMASDEIARK